MRRAVLLVLGGCTSIFGLDAPTRAKPPDASTDDVVVAPEDAPAVCTSVVNDEDSDAIDDACDACPTVPSDTSDADGDGLPNACDPNLVNSGDRILFARMFTAAGEILDLDPNQAMWAAADHGVVHLDDSGRLRTPNLAPTKIELRVLGFTGTDALEIRAPGVTCTIRPETCFVTPTAMCAEMTPGTNYVELAAASSELRRVVVTPGSGGTKCELLAGGALAEVSSTGMLGNGSTEVRIGLDSATVVQSIVVYGAK